MTSSALETRFEPARSAMPYFLSIKTYPGHRLDDGDVASLQSEARQKWGSLSLYRSNDGDVADIDVSSLEDELSSGNFTWSEFERFCESFGILSSNEPGQISPEAAQVFLEHKWGQEVLSLRLPENETSASECYDYLVQFALEKQHRLWSPMPGVGDIDLNSPGHLPPLWERYSHH